MSHADARGADGETALGACVGVAGNHASGYRMWDAHRRWVLVHPPVTQDLGTGRRLQLQGALHQAGVRSGPHLRPRMTGVASGSAAQEGSVTRGVDTLALTAGSLHLCLSPPAAGTPEVCSSPWATSWAWGLCRHTGPRLRELGAPGRGAADSQARSSRLRLTRMRTQDARAAQLAPPPGPQFSPLLHLSGRLCTPRPPTAGRGPPNAHPRCHAYPRHADASSIHPRGSLWHTHTGASQCQP